MLGKFIIQKLAGAVISGFGFSLGAALYKKASPHLGLPSNDSGSKPDSDGDNASQSALSTGRAARLMSENLCDAAPDAACVAAPQDAINE